MDKHVQKIENESLLTVQGLSLGFQTENGVNKVVDDISFHVEVGEIVGIVGESGSGKSVTALSIMNLLSKDARRLGGTIYFENKDPWNMSDKKLRDLRGNGISMIFQEPMTSLNPVLTIGYQLEEMLILHETMSKEERRAAIISMLEEVGLRDKETLLHKYPHELSGGMRQRVMIAMAMLCNPKLLIADEPTTALDVTIQAMILKLLKKLNQTHGTSILLISHNLNVIRSICNRAIVMYGGRIVEEGRVEELFHEPKEDYTKKLLHASSREHILDVKDNSTKEVSSEEHRLPDKSKKNILEVNNLQIFYHQKKESLFPKRMRREVVKGVSFDMKKGEILGIVGESGCGKSSLAKAIAGLQEDIKGSIQLPAGRPQMVFQDPYSSLNPSKKIGWLLEEPLRLAKSMSKEERGQRVRSMLKEVGLPEDYANRYPSDLSGGQRQRVAIAMAIILNKELILLDEPVSALDVTVQAQILALLLKLRNEYDLSYLFISHDMGVIEKICDRVLVMYQGEIVEIGTTKEIFEHPKHAYTKKLLEAIP